MKTHLIRNLLIIILFVAGLSRAEQPAQTTCPVMEGNPIDPTLFVDYEGQRIYFCCKMCVGLFKESPEQYLPNLAVDLTADHHSDTSASDSNDHHSDHLKDPSFPSHLITFIGKFHPIAVHFPIGLILMAALAEFIFLCFGSRPLFRSAARFNINLAVLGAVAAIILGLATASGTVYPAAYAEVLLRHKTMAFITLAVSMLSAFSLEFGMRKDRPAWIVGYRILLFIAAVLVALTGHLGGMLVHGLNHFSW